MKKNLIVFFLFLLFSVNAFSQDPLPAQQVFHFSTKILDPNTILLHWEIKPGYFLYRSRIKVTSKNHNIQLGTIRMPKGITKKDKLNGQYEIYRQSVGIPLPVLGIKSGPADLLVQFQGCADSGFCYPPMAKLISLNINKSLAITKLDIKDAESYQTDPIASERHFVKSDAQNISDLLSNRGMVLVILSFLGFGLLLSFTPCVLPMIPVLSGIIIGHGKDITTKKAFLLSLTYVLSMSATYAVVGIIVAGLGANLQVALQNPWAITMFAVIFVLLALSMFGFYELKLPLGLQQKISGISQHQKSGAYLGVAVMGFLSTLILSPCITAPLVGALTYIANSGDMFLGGLALFFLGIGMGIPLLLIGTSAGKLIPKAGSWMNFIKAFFGVLLMGVAIYLISRIIPGTATLILWAILFVVCAHYILNMSSEQYQHAHPLAQSCSYILKIYGVLLLIGASLGAQSPLNPLAPLVLSVENKNTSNASTKNIQYQVVSSIADVKKAIQNARGKPILLDFYADWCISCHWMDKVIFNDSKIKAQLQQFILLKADITQNNKKDKALLQYFNVIAPPTYIFFDSKGKELTNARVVGETNADTFMSKLDFVLKKSR